MKNSACGNTMKGLRKRINMKLINNPKDYLKYLNKPSFTSQRSLTKILLLFTKLNLF